MTNIPVQITCRDIALPSSTEDLIRDKAVKLIKFHERLSNVEIRLDTPHRHQRKGRMYHVRVLMNVPGKQLVVNHLSGEEAEHQDLMTAVGDALRTARRELTDHASQIDDKKRQTHPM